MRFPFGLSPKPKHEGPFYADMYTRAMAAAIDLLVLFKLFQPAFEQLSSHIFRNVDHAIFPTSEKSMALTEFVSRLWYSHFISLWCLNATLQFAALGIAIIGCQLCFETTAGKWVMGIRIRRAKTLGPVAFWRYPLRYLGYFLSAAPLMLGVLWISFNRERRAWHDYIAGTVVVNERPPGWYWKKIKQCWQWLRQKIRGGNSAPVEEPVREPAPGQRHEDGN